MAVVHSHSREKREMSVNMSHEKECLRDSDQVRHKPGCIDTDLQFRIKAGRRGIVLSKALSSSAVIAHLTCAFVVAYMQKASSSLDAAHNQSLRLRKHVLGYFAFTE